MRTKLILFLLIGLLIPVTAYAHPGGTDSNGGHLDHSTGEYHYHHGNEAHQHPDGVCPYDFDDQTGQSSGTSSSVQTSDPSPTLEDPEWVLVTEGFGVDFYYCEATDQWKSQDGAVYDSTEDFYQTFGFTYDPDDRRWYSDYGYIDADGNYCLYEACGMYVCPECGHVIEDDKTDHSDTCDYLSIPSDDTKEYSPLKIVGWIILGILAFVPVVLAIITWIAAAIGTFRQK